MVEEGHDQTLGSNLSLGQQDTIGDLVADGAGPLGGGLFLVA